MANIEFGVYSKKVPVNLNIRFYHNKIDINAKTNIFIFDSDFKFKKYPKEKGVLGVLILSMQMSEEKLINSKEMFLTSSLKTSRKATRLIQIG